MEWLGYAILFITSGYAGLCTSILVSMKTQKEWILIFSGLIVTLIVQFGIMAFSYGSGISTCKDFHRGNVEIYYHSTNGVVTDTTYRLK